MSQSQKVILGAEEVYSWCQSQISSFTSKQIILLEGELGAGKTYLVQQFVKALGGEGALSPTFSLINSYEVSKSKVYHVDLYRLESEEELESIGFWDLFDGDALVFIEWPSRMDVSQLPVDFARIRVSIEFARDLEKRAYTLTEGLR